MTVVVFHFGLPATAELLRLLLLLVLQFTVLCKEKMLLQHLSHAFET